MRTPIVYVNTRHGLLWNMRRILAARDLAFPATRVPRAKLRWVVCSKSGGYWTTGG